MKKVIYLINLLSMAIFIYSCSEESIGQTPIDGIPPQNVTDVKVVSIPGGAILTYKLPDDEDLLCVKATYVLNNGKISEEKASLYTDTLKLMGFGDTNERIVKIITIDRSANESQPIEVKVKPLEAPIYGVMTSLELDAAFGGLNVSWKNPTEGNIIINIDMLNEKNEYIALDKIYTKTKSGIYKIRGMEAKDVNLRYYITDRWQNATTKSDTLMTPMFEERVPISLIEPMQTHSTNVAWGWQLPNLFDNNIGSGYHTEEDKFWPHYFSFKIKQGPVKLSRIRLYQRENYQYDHGNLRRFAVYGRNDYPVPGNRLYADNSDYVNWIKIGEFESIKPSGLPIGTNSNEDLEYARRGEDFDVDVKAGAYQYYRVESLKSWSGSPFICFMEFQMWGQPEGYEFPK